MLLYCVVTEILTPTMHRDKRQINVYSLEVTSHYHREWTARPTVALPASHCRQQTGTDAVNLLYLVL